MREVDFTWVEGFSEDNMAIEIGVFNNLYFRVGVKWFYGTHPAININIFNKRPEVILIMKEFNIFREFL